MRSPESISGDARVTKWRKELPQHWLAVFMNAPAAILLAALLAYPVIYAGFLSLHEVNLMNLRSGFFPFVGFGNFVVLFEDPLFVTSLKNTLIFTVIVVPLELIFSILVALLINQSGLWTSRISRLLILVPYAVPPIASGMIWNFIFNVKFGYLNRFLYQIGAIDHYVDWVGHVDTAIWGVAVAYIWRTLPLSILLVHAALQAIPSNLYEAANIDGASPWKSFWHITLPMLRPIIAITLILRTTFSIMVFEEIMTITNGGPGDATTTASWYIFQKTFEPPFNIGLGTSAAYFLSIIIALTAVLYLKFVYRRIYD